MTRAWNRWGCLAIAGLCLAMSAGLGSALAASPAAGGSWVDDRGRSLSLSEAPQRIVSLLPSLTETVCALGACSRLVAVDDFSNWPASVRALPRVGGLEDARIEAIVALRPDLVLAAASTRAIDRLERLGLKVVALEPTSLEGFRRTSLVLDRVLGTGRAAQLLREVDDGLQAAARSVPAQRRGQRVYFEVGEGPYAAGESSFIGELLSRLGAANVVPASLGPFPRLNPEFVVRADPQVIMVGEGTGLDMPARPGWSGIRALREGRVCRFSPQQGDVLVRPGPRMAEGARLMAGCLRGDAQGGR